MRRSRVCCARVSRTRTRRDRRSPLSRHTESAYYNPAVDAQNPAEKFWPSTQTPVRFTPLASAQSAIRNPQFPKHPVPSPESPARLHGWSLVLGHWSFPQAQPLCRVCSILAPHLSLLRCSPTPTPVQCCVSPPLTSVGLVAVPATGIVPLHIGAHRRTVRRVRPKV